MDDASASVLERLLSGSPRGLVGLDSALGCGSEPGLLACPRGVVGEQLGRQGKAELRVDDDRLGKTVGFPVRKRREVTRW